jgi:Gluconate 2-dehydrogenase subunit 3
MSCYAKKKMKRRHAIQSLAAVAIPLPVFAQRAVEETPKLETTVADAGAAPVARFFSTAEFAVLRRLSELLMPAAKGNPGALEAGVPEFLDFLIAQSPPERQNLYREGLDRLEADSRRRYFKPFAELSADQADAVLAPLHAAWTYAGPTDVLGRFLAEAKSDVMTATTNSREWIAAQAGRSRRAAGVDYYWLPTD